MINPPRERRIVFRAYLDTVEYVYADISIIGRGTGSALTGIVSHLLYTARLYAALISSLPAERRRRVASVSRDRSRRNSDFSSRILRSTRAFFRREFRR